MSGTQNAGNRAGGTIVGTKLDLHVIASLAAGEYSVRCLLALTPAIYIRPSSSSLRQSI